VILYSNLRVLAISICICAHSIVSGAAESLIMETHKKIDVTQTADALGLPPVMPAVSFDSETAKENSKRIKAILEHPHVGSHCLIYFPAGTYYFDGAVDGWQGTIETTAPYQTICGDGMNVTRILQNSRSVESTIRLRHSNVTLERLFIGSVDTSDTFNPLWEEKEQRHQAAIHLDAPVSDGRAWSTDPRIRQVTINSYGNSILQTTFSRPFEIGVKMNGSWLDVFIDEMWINDTAIGVYVYQGAVMAGPAKIMRINQYSTHPPGRSSKLWTTFFKSEGHFMEQVELIHNTFIGAQFIYMDGRPFEDDGDTSPAYDMVIDHNYINVHDVGEAPEAREPGPWNSGIYMNLHPRTNAGNYTRDIRFTNNSCTGRAPSRGAFFYVEGMCRGLTFSHNDISSPAIDKAIYIRATKRLEQDGVSRADDTAIRDIKITHNYFRSFRNVITIGGDAEDPERLAQSENSVLRGVDDDPWWVQRVVIAHNQNMMEGASDTLGLTTCYLNRVRQGVVESNTFTETAGSALVINNSEEISVIGNSFRGLNETGGNRGIALMNTHNATVTGNVLAQFSEGLYFDHTRHVSIGNNTVRDAQTGISATNNNGLIVNGNSISDAEIGINSVENSSVVLSSNHVDATTGLLLSGNEVSRDSIVMTGNIGLTE